MPGKLSFFPESTGSPDKRDEQRMGLERSRFEFRLKLTAEKPWMFFQFYDFNQPVFRVPSRDDQPGRFEPLFVFRVEFVTVAMPFADEFCFVN